MRKNSRGGFRSSRGPNSKEWDGTTAGVLALSGGTAGFWIIDPVQAIDDYESPTVIRLLVAFTSRQTVAPSAAAGAYGFGIYVASGDEDDVTVPSLLWDVIGDEQSDWMYRLVQPTFPGLPVNQISTSGGNDIGTDVRTKRKIPRGAGLLGVFTAFAASGTSPSADMTVNVRALLISG